MCTAGIKAESCLQLLWLFVLDSKIKTIHQVSESVAASVVMNL